MGSFRVALRKESVDRNADYVEYNYNNNKSLSARRAWIEIAITAAFIMCLLVALRKESVDRNHVCNTTSTRPSVALRKESVDRNARLLAA